MGLVSTIALVHTSNCFANAVLDNNEAKHNRIVKDV